MRQTRVLGIQTKNTILVTGGAGFIGSHLVKSLAKKGSKVRVLDLHPRGDVEPDVEQVAGSVTKLDDMKAASKDCQIVIHLAALVGVRNSESNLVGTLDTNILGTKNVLEASRLNDVDKILLSSSSEVYGQPSKIPIEETDQTTPVTTYGVSKLAAEEYLKTFGATYGIRYSILRLFNAYGPGQTNEFVIPEFVHKALRDKPVVLHGDGSQIRAFCHVEDIVQGFSRAFARGDREILNIGNSSEPISVRHLAEKIITLASSKSKLRFQAFSATGRGGRREILHRIPSTEKAKRLLGYIPRIGLSQGLLTVIDFMKESH